MSDYMQTEAVDQQTIEFVDATPQEEIPSIAQEDVTHDVTDYDDVDLNNFMSRPIRIATVDWSYNTSIGGTFNPWSLYFNDTRVKNRLAYYNLLKCKLCVKFVINGNQFQYGRLMFDYLPLTAYFIDGNTYNDNLSYIDTTNTTVYPVAATQRSHIMLEPGKSEGGCMELPFFWPYNWLSIPLEQWQYLGSMRYYSINPLRHANDASALDTPRISVFAWAEDVKIGVPTASPPATLAPQAGKETIGRISGPATAVSNTAKLLSMVPGLGPFAMATDMVASSIGSLAKTFGYSRPLIETPLNSIKPDYGGNLANADRPEIVNKFTVDSSNEITIDPSVTGVNRGDELVISSIVSKETYLTQFDWTYANNPDTFLWSSRVTPALGVINPTYTVTKCIMPTALQYGSIPFRYWRGSIIYRFEIVCSAFHKGRLRVVYDPSAQQTTGTVFNQNYSTIMDIEDTCSFEVKVNWGVHQVALRNSAPSFTANNFNTGIAMTHVNNFDNGTLAVYVLNTLAVPNRTITAAQSGVYVNVYVRAGPDFEVAVPDSTLMDTITTAAPFTPAAGEEVGMYEVGKVNPVGNRDVVLFGETIVSFRTLMKRYQGYLTWSNVTSATFSQVFAFYNRLYPLFAGNDSGGIDTVTNLQTTGSFSGNYINMTLIQYLMSAFSGIRGSVRYKYQIGGTNNQPVEHIVTAVRLNTTAAAISVPKSTAIASVTSSTLSANMRALVGSCLNGAISLRPSRSPLLELEIPYYSAYRFWNPKSLNNNTISMDGHSVVIANTTNLTASNWLMVQSFVAIGEDFNLVNYTGPGLLWATTYY
jgi:hypothetical protein